MVPTLINTRANIPVVRYVPRFPSMNCSATFPGYQLIILHTPTRCKDLRQNLVYAPQVAGITSVTGHYRCSGTHANRRLLGGVLSAPPQTPQYEPSVTTIRSVSLLITACGPSDCGRCAFRGAFVCEHTGSFSAPTSFLSRNNSSIRQRNTSLPINPFSYNSNSLSLRRGKCWGASVLVVH